MKDSDLLFGIMVSLGREEYTIPLLKHLLEPFSVTESSLRTNLSRMTEKEILSIRREGRKAFYSFNRKGRRIGGNVSFSFNRLDWSDWDSRWWGFLYSIPSEDKALRHKIRTKLSVHRFGNLYPGTWIRPKHNKEEIPSKFKNYISKDYGHLIDFDFHKEPSIDQIQRMWNIAEINSEMLKSIRQTEEAFLLLEEADSRESFRLNMITGNSIVQTLFKDPMLPPSFLPENWHGDELRELFMKWNQMASKHSQGFIDEGVLL